MPLNKETTPKQGIMKNVIIGRKNRPNATNHHGNLSQAKHFVNHLRPQLICHKTKKLN